MKSLFDEKTYEEVLQRLNKITSETKPQWGKMNAGQMMRHCQFPLKIALKNGEPMSRPNPLMRLLFKSFKKGMYNDKPWKRGMPTPKQFQVADERDFDLEHKKLVQLVNETHQLKTKKKWEPHPSFGHFTHDQWGKMQYKHLDHHFRQFGV